MIVALLTLTPEWSLSLSLKRVSVQKLSSARGPARRKAAGPYTLFF